MSCCDCKPAVRAASLALLALLGACATQPAPRAAAPSAGATPVATSRALPLNEAVAQLATAMVQHAQLPPPGPDGRYPIVIDPWIDRATGQQVATTRLMASEIQALAPANFPMLELLPFTPASLERKPLVLLGAIAAVGGPGQVQTVATRPGAYRIYGALADLQSGRIVSQESAWVQPQGVDMTPTVAFRDSPAWTTEPTRSAYLRAATAAPGQGVDADYLAGLRASALAVQGAEAYEAGRYPQALALYQQAAALAGGRQLRVLNGLYLANQALEREPQAEAAFGQLVGFGLSQGRLAVKFLFAPGSAAFWPDPAISGAYPMWLRQVAEATEHSGQCLKRVGHASPRGSAAANQRLSALRARRVASLLARDNAALRGRLRAEGVGARNPIIGTGADNATDVLDRRVEFEPYACPRV